MKDKEFNKCIAEGTCGPFGDNLIEVVNGPAAGCWWGRNDLQIHEYVNNGKVYVYEIIDNCWVNTKHRNIERIDLDEEQFDSSVNNPEHYNQYSVECIDVAENMNFNMGNALKYIWRCGSKDNPIKDLMKAKWYIEREIKRRQNK